MTSPIVASITDEQLADLEHIASKATPGDWWIDSHGHSMVSMDDYQQIFTAMDLVVPAVRHAETGNLSHWPNDWDATYIATACPKNIQGLIARLRAAEKDAARYRWLADGGYDHIPYSDMWVDQGWLDKVVDLAMEQSK